MLTKEFRKDQVSLGLSLISLFSLFFLSEVGSFFSTFILIYSSLPGFWVKVYPSFPTDYTGYFFFQNLIKPLLSSYFLYYYIVIKHLLDFYSLLLTWGANLANPIFFHIAFDLFVKDLWIIMLISLVFLGSSHNYTSPWLRITGILSWTAANYGVASFVNIMI